MLLMFSIGRYYYLLALILCFYHFTAQASNSYVGSNACQSCHSQPYALWQKSHHFKAMQLANANTVLGDFNDAIFEYRGLRHRFSQKQGSYYIVTDNAEGKLQQFKIAYTFGFEPLQQYLIAMPDGRYQVLNIAWDARKKQDGGQRWFHLHADNDAIDHQSPLHWTGYFQNWNSRCASCHSTDVKKNYDIASNTFDTQYAELNVACESCHGPGSEHIAWAKSTNLQTADKHILTLQDSGQWQFTASSSIANRIDGTKPKQQLEACAACHALRTEFSDAKSNIAFSDQFGLRLLEQHFYEVDGKIDDEVFVYGSFLQSKMYQAGVVCTDCHDPHSGQIRGSTEAVCLQCHSNEKYNQPSHHQHTSGTSGSFCVDCHMPAKTYMGVDKRRDHSFSIPHPELSARLGTSNACIDCHQDQSNQWAAKARAAWPNKSLLNKGIDVDYSEALFASRQGNRTIIDNIIQIINDDKQSDIKRATALLELANIPSQPAYMTSMLALEDDSPLIRAAAIQSLSYVPAQRRQGYVAWLNDPAKSVRMTLAPFLAELPDNGMPRPIVEQINNLFVEYETMQNEQADMPSAQLELGNFYMATGKFSQAEQAFKQALRINPSFAPALLNLAELSRQIGNLKEEETFLRDASVKIADSPAVAHAMGLFKVRQKQMKDALAFLQKASKLAPENARYAYVYAIALNSTGASEKALLAINSALLHTPYNPELLQLKKTLKKKE